jgi:protein PhnA
MQPTKSLLERANNSCEICSQTSTDLNIYTVPTHNFNTDADVVILCNNCNAGITNNDYANAENFRGIQGSIWSETSSVKVLSYKIAQQLLTIDWAQEVVDSAYLTEEELAWANSEAEATANIVVHKDAYGAVLQSGDNILLTENLNVKGTNFIAPKGTKVPKIRLVADNAEQIEGKIEGSTIVILTKFVRKSN